MPNYISMTRGEKEDEDSEHPTTMSSSGSPDPASEPMSVTASRHDSLAMPKRGPQPRTATHRLPEDMGAAVWINTAVLWAGLSPRAFMMYMALASYTNAKHDDPNLCWPSVTTLAKKLGISTRQAQRALGELAACGFVRVEERPGESNLYRLVNRQWPPKGKRTQASTSTPDKSVTPTPDKYDTPTYDIPVAPPTAILSPTPDRDVMSPPTEMSPKLEERKKGDREEEKRSSNMPGSPTTVVANAASSASHSPSTAELLEAAWDATGVDKNSARLKMRKGWKEITGTELTAADWLAVEAQRADENQRKTYGNLSIGWSIAKIIHGDRAPEEFHRDQALEPQEIIPNAIPAKRTRFVLVTCRECRNWPPLAHPLPVDADPAVALADLSCPDCGGHQLKWENTNAFGD